MRIATRPRHIRLAIQIISLHQNRDPTQVVASETVTHLITASIRLGCPELAVSFLTLPWVRVNPTAKNIEMLLEYNFASILRCSLLICADYMLILRPK